MIKFYPIDNKVIFSYTPSYGSSDNWVEKELEKEGYVTLKKTFTFQKKHIYHPPLETHQYSEHEIYNNVDFDEDIVTSYFVFAVEVGDYYKVNEGILIEKFDIYFYKEISIEPEYFIVDSNVSIFNSLQPLLTSDLYIGGEHPGALSKEGLTELISRFPTSYEKKKYMEARISAVLREHFESLKDGEKVYHQYLNKKIGLKETALKKTFQEFELIKYQAILARLEEMLNSEEGYSEKIWQEQILEILQLIYPKYIFVFREVPIKDKNIKDRFLDYMLVDSSGYTDIIEIKRPFGKTIVTDHTYRNNFIPLRELSGTIMQIEKYIYYLNRWGVDGEKYLTEKYKNKLPEGFEIRITNPNGIIIMGRENNLSLEQKADFEVVKRKYKNVVDIITYDNLIHRLKSMIEQIKKL